MTPAPHLQPVEAETVAERVRRLMAEARGLAREHVAALEKALLDVESLAAEIADGGEAYAAGIRDLAGRVAEDAKAKAQNLASLSEKAT